jgi:HAD superfamily hydrolase (TIGR01509 family)
MTATYRRELPLLPGAVEAVRRIAARWPLGLASSANREIIDAFLELSGLGGEFRVTLSSEQVGRGKPAPDVYLEVTRRLGVDGSGTVAIEDSDNGIRAAAAAGLTVVAIPNPHYPPGDALTLAAASVETPGELTPELLESVAS